jgi:hypothetical protein
MGVLVLVLILTYNRLVGLKNRSANAFAQIDVQLKRRHDLIPNLVETARAYLAHERSTLDAVTEARNVAQAAGRAAAQNPADAQALTAMAKAESALTSTLGRFFVICSGSARCTTPHRASNAVGSVAVTGESALTKRFPIRPKHPERICRDFDMYCPAYDLACGSGTDLTHHPCELFGEDWLEFRLDAEQAKCSLAPLACRRATAHPG